jgi:hypothetical protein
VDADRWIQAVLGLLTTGLLIVAILPLDRDERAQVYACMLISTAIELFATQLWGVYRYRLGNVPLFVPPGHGLICAIAIHVARMRSVIRAQKLFVRGTLAIAVAAALFGLVVMPRFGFPIDIEGAMFLPGFIWLLLGTKRASEHAATFFLATLVELVGVYFGNWHWNELMPTFLVSAGNPPTVAAGGYCWFSALGILALAGLKRSRTFVAGRAA